MSLWSRLFPSQRERLRRVSEHLAAGRTEEARRELLKVRSEDAERLYERLSDCLDRGIPTQGRIARNLMVEFDSILPAVAVTEAAPGIAPKDEPASAGDARDADAGTPGGSQAMEGPREPEKPRGRSSKKLRSLRLQLFNDSYLSMVTPDALVAEPFAPGLTAAVVLDVAGLAEQTLNRREAQGWGLTDRELLDRARAQGAAADAAQVVFANIGLADGALVELMVSNSFYLSSVMLESLHRAPAPRGTLVAALSWHHWGAHAVTETTSRRTLELMGELVRKIAGDIEVSRAETLSADLFWHRPGKGCVRVVSWGEDGSCRLDVPPELEAMLATAS